MLSDARQKLANQQACLVRVLTRADAPPEGFDSAALAVAAGSLQRKRARTVEKAWPLLAAALHERFDSRFEHYAAQQPIPESAAEDGYRFARWLGRTGQLPDAGRLELASWQVLHRFPARIVLLREPAGVALLWRWRGRTSAMQFRIPRRFLWFSREPNRDSGPVA